ncbi:hypothetical protein B0A50_02888 [Salinomyces thailandicus]|uniref:Pentatricopeptide repeat-containing protein-mitochondrial domain-containing protein n=1 Tax=Salinomyces thailandicus TaxID=706561 RepID=A0A4V6WJV1_9PEZI|nr:hypothetical protein B0A50_02888 [Salinomyces thailandica]
MAFIDSRSDACTARKDDMQPSKLAIDPLWQALCPSWTQATVTRASGSLQTRKRVSPRSLNRPPLSQKQYRSVTNDSAARPPDFSGSADAYTTTRSTDDLRWPQTRHHRTSPASGRGDEDVAAHEPTLEPHQKRLHLLRNQPIPFLLTRLRSLATTGNVQGCREQAELLVRERREKPSTQLYSALIGSNVSAEDGAAWRVIDYLDEMRNSGLQIDARICHVVLKVLSVHTDHLLRADILEHMRTRWFQLSEEGAHDVAAGLLREGQFELALDRIEDMRRNGVQVQGWLLDMAVYMLCSADEIEEAYRIMRLRQEAGEIGLSRTLWYTLLDASSSHRHHASTSLVWNSQVGPGYLNPSSGICLNVLTTASQAGDAELATDVFTHLSKRGTQFQHIHYQLLIECYLAASPPDIKRSLSILTIMALEKTEPSLMDTRALFAHLRKNPELTAEALTTLRNLHEQGRKIPIAALNLIIEAYVDQSNLPEAIKVYKLIHTFVPLTEGAKKSFANHETFNLLLRGCRLCNPPDEEQASFLVSELLALKVKPTKLTYDRLILVFIEASDHALRSARSIADETERQTRHDRGVQLLEWAFRHFADMQAISSFSPDRDFHDDTSGWIPRFGTLNMLGTKLATLGDGRCWDVLQAGEDHADQIEGWAAKGYWVRTNIDRAWKKFKAKKTREQDAAVLAGPASEADDTSLEYEATAAAAH